jgi:hypothetical protein
MILHIVDYIQKINSLLEDPSYRKLTRDPTVSTERKTTLLLKKSTLIEYMCKQLRPAGSRMAQPDKSAVTEHSINPLNPELDPICYLLALLGAHHFLHVGRIRVKSLTLRLIMSYIYGAPILDVSRSHTTTQHSR